MISIVLPTFNRKTYLIQSIESVINQTYKDWELIIVDDCSTDGTFEMAQGYAAKDNRIRVIRNKTNMRLPASLNIGMENSRGEFLTWTSDDNLFKPWALEKLLSFLETENQVIVSANMDIIDEKGDKLYDHPMQHFTFDEDKIYYENIIRGCFLYRREVKERVGNYNEQMFCLEDYDYWIRIYKEYGRVGYLNERLYDYRVHVNSLTETKRNTIDNMAYKFRMENLDYLLLNAKHNSLAIIDLFCEKMDKEKHINHDIYDKVCQLVPEFEIVDINDDLGGKHIIYGAGNFGRRVNKLLGRRAYCFADMDKRLVGKIVDEKKVISLEEMIKINEDFTICVSAYYDRIYSMLKFLRESAVKKCILCYQVFQCKDIED